MFQVVEGLTDDILSVNRALDSGATVVFSPSNSYVEWSDGTRADFDRQARQFIMPYTEVASSTRAVRIAAVSDPEAEAVTEYARRQEADGMESDDDRADDAEVAIAEAEEAEDLEQQAPEPEPPQAVSFGHLADPIFHGKRNSIP